MRKQPVQQRPPYPLDSVDNALRLLQLLRDGGALRLTECAGELGVAPSTAHRLLSMLVYRGFAVRDDERRYVAGPALGAPVIDAPWVRGLRDGAADPMLDLSRDLDETVNLLIRVGSHVRFIATTEGPNVLHVGDRTGSVLSAAEASGGKALLALEPPERVRALFSGSTAELAGHSLEPAALERLERELDQARRHGYAVNKEETEPGVGAVGAAIVLPGGRSLAAISVAAPAARLDGVLRQEAIAVILACRDRIAALAADLVTGPG